MSLRTQLGCLLAFLAVAVVTLTYSVQVFVVVPAFADIERQGAEKDLNRFVDAIAREEELLSHAVLDWSAWDDLYEYAEDRNEKFEQATLVEEAFVHAHVNVLFILNNNNDLVWGDVRDLDTNDRIIAPDILSLLQSPTQKVTSFENVDALRSGILPTSKGPLLLVSRPILKSNGQGPARGSITFGRFLSETVIQGIASRTHVDMSSWCIANSEIPQEVRSILPHLPLNKQHFLATENISMLYAFTTLQDIFHQPVLLVRANIKRDVTSQGRLSAYTATACCLIAAMFTLAILWIVLQQRIVNPLTAMAVHVERLGKEDDLKSKLNLHRDDEIGVLANSFDSMVSSLESSRRIVLESAHQAGMAEIASEVLHNVGNAVTSANCSIECLEQRLATTHATGLEKAVKLLNEKASNAAEFFTQDPRGPKLISYLVQLNEHLQEERTGNATEIKRLRDTIRHIREVISAQQAFAKRSDFRQEIILSELIDEVLRLNSHGIQSNEIEVDVDLPWLPELHLSKSKTTQVLVNLVKNAIHALRHQPTDNRKLSIQAKLVDDVDLEIVVSDSGCGFDEATRCKLFTQGFTTKEEGNGLGLHYCANAIRESGGNITAQSPGIGLGASFRIRLPDVIKQQALTPI